MFIISSWWLLSSFLMLSFHPSSLFRESNHYTRTASRWWRGRKVSARLHLPARHQHHQAQEERTLLWAFSNSVLVEERPELEQNQSGHDEDVPGRSAGEVPHHAAFFLWFYTAFQINRCRMVEPHVAIQSDRWSYRQNTDIPRIFLRRKKPSLYLKWLKVVRTSSAHMEEPQIKTRSILTSVHTRKFEPYFGLRMLANRALMGVLPRKPISGISRLNDQVRVLAFSSSENSQYGLY